MSMSDAKRERRRLARKKRQKWNTQLAYCLAYHFAPRPTFLTEDREEAATLMLQASELLAALYKEGLEPLDAAIRLVRVYRPSLKI